MSIIFYMTNNKMIALKIFHKSADKAIAMQINASYIHQGYSGLLDD